jgi:hypothetical protein
MDDGNCTIETCGYESPNMGEAASNYNPDATIDNGTCDYGSASYLLTLNLGNGNNLISLPGYLNNTIH